MIWKCSYYVIIISIFRFIKFDLQIASVFLNGSCHSLARENVTLSYRIGNDNQWKIIGEYASVGEYEFQLLASYVCSVISKHYIA